MNITGTNIAEVLAGTALADTILGLDGNDTITGGAGNDIITGGAGADAMSGGDDNDTFIQDVFGSFGDTIDGGLGTDTVEFRTAATPIDTKYGSMTLHSMASASSLVSIERLLFVSTASQAVQASITAAAASGLARVTGGAGRDILTISTGTAAGSFAVPNLSVVSWGTVPVNAWESTGDLVILSAELVTSGAVTLTAASGAPFLQMLIGGAGNDVLSGSTVADIFDVSAGGDVVYAGSGNDMIQLVNAAAPNGSGWDQATAYTGAGGVYNGEGGTDVLSIGGAVYLQATLTGIEGVQLQAAFNPASPTAPVQGWAELTLDSAHLAMLPANAFFAGTGTVKVILDSGASFNGSQFTFTPGANVGFQIYGRTGDGVSIVGTSGGDYIQFGFGVQSATGGAGADVFSPGAGINTVTDFQLGVDKISLAFSGVSSLSRLDDFITDSAAGVGFSVDSGGVHYEAHLTGITKAQLTPSHIIFNPGTMQVLEDGTALDDFIYGFALNDELSGAGGNDRIYTGGGLDTVLGGSGDDTIVIDGAGTAGSLFDGGIGTDTAILRAHGGAVQSPDGPLTVYDLSPGLVAGSGLIGVEKIRFDSAAGTALTAGALRTGITEVIGGAGRDTLVAIVTSAGSHDLTALTLTGWNKAVGGDRLTLLADQTLIGAVTLTARSDVAEQTLVGAQGADTLNGSAFADVLVGGAGNDTLNSGGGADKLNGGLGNDFYRVASQFALVFEAVGEGTDTVESSASFYLYANVENLTLTGTAALFGVGNELANTIVGNAGSNLLIANEGDDTVSGGGGVDTLYGMSGKDVLNGDDGNDALIGGSENDTLNGGNGADALYGEDGDDVLNGGTSFDTDILVGGAGNDVLNGISGQANPDFDQLDGGAGNDTYWVDTGADLTFEAAGGGIDTVHADIKVANAGVYLYANVENLVLEGTTTFGVGNALANTITGNAAANLLLGGAGDDRIAGGAGNDVLFGEAGADTFVFTAGSGADVIGDFARGTDRIELIGYGLDFTAVKALFVQNGTMGGIQLANGDVVVLQGVTMSQLTASDFIFG